MKKSEFDAFVVEILREFDSAQSARATLLASILRSRALNDLALVADNLLSEVDLEGLTRRAKSGDEYSDVKLLDDPDQEKFQFEAHGADPIDPTKPVEDTSSTLSELSPINQAGRQPT